MSANQKAALAAMYERNLGAVLTALGWTWPCHIRESEAAAQAALVALGVR